ncbi:MAG: NUDIX domain-containing protein, partial [Candidatus Omnitrophota bacterium]
KNHEIFWRLQEKLIPQNLARQFNQALMELGALICLTQNPSCPLCPIRPYCKAARRGDPENYPVKIKRKKTVRVIASAAILEHKGRYLIRRRPLGAVMGGLWEFPEWKLGQNKELDAHQIQNLTRRRLKREFGIHLGRSRRLEPIKRNYTHHLEILYPFQIAVKTARPDVLPGSGAARWPHAWITLKDFGRYPFSSAHAKMAARLG